MPGANWQALPLLSPITCQRPTQSSSQTLRRTSKMRGAHSPQPSPGQGWPRANSRVTQNSRGNPAELGRGLGREGERLGKNGMSSLIGVFHEGQGEGQGETHSPPQLCSLLSGAQLLPPSPGNQRQVYMEPGLRDVTEARKAGGGGGDCGWALLIIRD